MHKKVMALVANRGQNEHYIKNKELKERADKFDYDFRT